MATHPPSGHTAPTRGMPGRAWWSRHGAWWSRSQSVVVTVTPAAAAWLCVPRPEAEVTQGQERSRGINWAVPSPGLILGPGLDLATEPGHISIPQARVLLSLHGEKHLLSAAALRPPAQTLRPSAAVLFPSLSVGLSPRDTAASASLRSAKSPPVVFTAFETQNPQPPASSGPLLKMLQCGAVFCRLPRAGSGDNQDITALDCPRCHHRPVPLLRAVVGGDAAALGFAASRCWVAFLLQRVFGSGASCVRRFRSASPALPRSLPRVMPLRFSGPRAAFQGHSLAGWPRSWHGDGLGGRNMG